MKIIKKVLIIKNIKSLERVLEIGKDEFELLDRQLKMLKYRCQETYVQGFKDGVIGCTDNLSEDNEYSYFHGYVDGFDIYKLKCGCNKLMPTIANKAAEKVKL